jgi:copper homeostasis protein
MKKLIFEAPVFTVEAAMKAAEVGVHRLELCADFGEGGVTPSIGMLEFLKGKIDIPVYVMIRPRGGDFIYSSEERYVMRKDIIHFREAGADGFVFGILNAEGDVDIEACKYLLQVAEELPCTFHRAFDVCANQERALEKIIQCGFSRVLTSGGAPNVELGFDQIVKMMRQAKDQLIVMPGGGLLPRHVEAFLKLGDLEEFHASCKSYRPSFSNFSHPTVQLSNDAASAGKVLTLDPDLVGEFLKILL